MSEIEEQTTPVVAVAAAEETAAAAAPADTTEEPAEKAEETEKAEEKAEEPEKAEDKAEETEKAEEAEKEETEETEEAAMEDEEAEGQAKSPKRGAGPGRKPKAASTTPAREGGRDRKAVVRLTMETTTKSKELEIPKGKGTHIKDLENAMAMLKKYGSGADVVGDIHRVLFGRRGKKNEVKGNIRNFNGFETEGQAELATDRCQKIVHTRLKDMANVFCVDPTGTKDDVATRLVEFMKLPADTGREPPAAKKKSTKKKAATKKRKKPASKKKKKDPNAIKRPPHAYFIFSNEIRKSKQDENKGLPVTEISKLISADWKELTEKQKEKYQEQAVVLKEEYLEKVAAQGGKKGSKKKSAKKSPKKKATPKKKKKEESEEEESEEESEEEESEDEPLNKKRKSGLTLSMENKIKEIMKTNANDEDLSVKKIRVMLGETFDADNVKEKKDEIKAFIYAEHEA